jgi:proteasome lid subunit RPN8/RPN11
MKPNKQSIEEMFQHAIETYPDECCGIITGNSTKQTVHPCQNIQNRLHSEDPERHPRDARTAYAIDRKEAEKIYAEAKKNKEDILAFYHSHTDLDAYFSDTDKEVQIVFGEPEFPEAVHIVISVRARKVCDIKCFKWDWNKKDFIFLEM